MYRVFMSRQAAKDKENIIAAGFGKRTKALPELLAENPHKTPPPYEKLTGDLKGFYSRRINRQHRLAYEVREAEEAVVIARMWTHYE